MSKDKYQKKGNELIVQRREGIIKKLADGISEIDNQINQIFEVQQQQNGNHGEERQMPPVGEGVIGVEAYVHILC